MDVFKAQLARIQQQLGALSASQKMLTASLLAIMVLTLMYWARYAGTPEMEPLLSQSLSSDDFVRIRARLTGSGVPYQVSGDRILVPTDRKFEAVALLAYDGALPSDTANSFEDIANKLNPFVTEKSADRMWNLGLQNALQTVIRKFPGVKDASVFISAMQERRVGANVDPSASVTIFLQPGNAPSRKLANTIADLVAGSHAALKRARVTVSINGESFVITDRTQHTIDGGGEISDQEQRAEKYFKDKLQEALQGYGAVNASVRVKLDIEASTTKETNVTEIKQKEKLVTSETSESTTASAASGEPGAASNMPLSVSSGAAAAPSGNSTNTSKESTAFDNLPSTQERVTSKPAGLAQPVSAAVNLPYGYFAGLLKSTSGGSKDPDPQSVYDYFAKSYQKRVVAQVKAATGIPDDSQIVVDLYMEQLPTLMAAGSDAATGGGGSGLRAVGGYAKEVAIGVLALLSLVMVSMMVKKSTPAPIVTAAAPLPEVEESITIGGDEAIAGEVVESDPALDGMELDDAAVRTQQVISQVSTMVKENPDAAANLVKRWLNRA